VSEMRRGERTGREVLSRVRSEDGCFDREGSVRQVWHSTSSRHEVLQRMRNEAREAIMSQLSGWIKPWREVL